SSPRKSQGVCPPRRVAGAGKPHCPRTPRRGRGGAESVAALRGSWFPGRRHQASDRAGGDRAPAACPFRAASLRRGRAAGRIHAHARPCARSGKRRRSAMTAVFITATGTDIGKTFLTAGLIRHIRSAGGAVAAIKPIVSGFDPGAWEESDPAVLLA